MRIILIILLLVSSVFAQQAPKDEATTEAMIEARKKAGVLLIVGSGCCIGILDEEHEMYGKPGNCIKMTSSEIGNWEEGKKRCEPGIPVRLHCSEIKACGNYPRP